MSLVPHPRRELRCFLIGADSLLVACGEVLLAQGHSILGVLTRASAVAAWAGSKGLAVDDPHTGAAQVLARAPFDHLFSITHLELIPPEIVRLPAVSAINFHDGPLPRYAGLNAPAWALIEGERRYGITWHVIGERIDAGAILAQKLFDVAPDETSLSLNTRCFEAGLESFGLLLDDLATGRATPIPQDTAQRSYYAKAKRPPAACALDWSRSARELEAFVRALDFGRYPNPLGAPKIVVAGKPFAVLRAAACALDAPAEPGTIVANGTIEALIVVATAEGALALREITTLAGVPIAHSENATHAGVAKGHGEFAAHAEMVTLADVPIAHGEPAARAELSVEFAIGRRLDTLTSEHAERLTALHAAISRHETYWAGRLESLAPIEIASASAATSARASEPREIAVAVPVSFRSRFGDAPAALTAALAAWLARYADRTCFDVGWSDAALAGAVDGLEDWLAARVPLRVDLDPDESFRAFLGRTDERLDELRAHKTYLQDLVARTPALHGRSALVDGSALPVAIVADRSAARASPASDLLVLHICAANTELAVRYDAARIEPVIAASIAAGIEHFLDRVAAAPEHPLGEHELLPESERALVLAGWNQTTRPYRSDATIDRLIEEQAERTPDRVALVCEGASIPYRELDQRSNRLAAHLAERGAGPERLVAVCLERSIDLVVAVLAVLKSGAAYLPLDPAFPKKRLAFMLADAHAAVVVSDERLAAELVPAGVPVVRLDADAASIAASPAARTTAGARPDQLAYVLYTSGSTGTPKGVMVEHGNVASFFAGIDERIEHEGGGTWLAVTSLSFDISVLELLWTLARGFTVVVHRDRERVGADARLALARPVDFSLFYFSSDEAEHGADKYRLLLEGARFADAHGFSAVWTPERHFHAFGGLYPHPAITSAALATITQRIALRAGSVVLPLHHPIRVAEAWSVVDNLSKGRVGISFASGWQPNDFVLAPESYARAKSAMFEGIETVRRLWRGETVEFAGVGGAPVAVRTLPRPIQKELPCWVTTAGNPETYVQAGAIGANVLTHLLGQSIGDLAPKIAAYRRARAEHGHGDGVVTLMLHTYVGDDEDEVLATVRDPLRQYLASSLALLKHYGWAFPAFARPSNAADVQGDRGDDLAHLSHEEHEALLDHAFERYYATSGLFGRPETCLAIVAKLAAIGVDEIACLIDFGVPTERALSALEALERLKELARRAAPGVAVQNGVAAQNGAAAQNGLAAQHGVAAQNGAVAQNGVAAHNGVAAQNGAEAHNGAAAQQGATPHGGATTDEDFSIAALIRRHGVTHLQCTPSLARILCLGADTRDALRSVRHLMIGGEPFPTALLAELAGCGASITNMYGPTETTIWSSTERVDAAGALAGGNGAGGTHGSVGIGRPIANTRFYVLDERRRPVPAGVPGELWIAGPGVARGYLARPELSAERFLPDPFQPARAERMYRTGDRVRRLAEGTIEFFGRVDHQVKVRGFRIELGEIEKRLEAHPALRQAVVLLRDERDGCPEPQLVAYCVADDLELDPEHLRAHLRIDLPEYMVPAQYVLLERLPLAPNGKIDRSALPAPDRVATQTKKRFVAPAGEIEELVAGLWRETLALDEVGSEDNFFDIGGHSLLVVRLHRRLQAALDRPLSLTDLYRFPTIRALARFLDSDGTVDLQHSADRAQRRRESIVRRRRSSGPS